jgi:hypothetical protein
MQIFFQYKNGRTVTMDVTEETTLQDVITYASARSTYSSVLKNIQVLDYVHNPHNVVVQKNTLLNPEDPVRSLFSNDVVKEVLFLVT